jgi:hypothetical protein
MPRDQDAILRGHDVGLDKVGPHLDRQLVGFEGVLREVPARASVSDDKGPFAGERLLLRQGGTRQPRKSKGKRRENCSAFHHLAPCDPL